MNLSIKVKIKYLNKYIEVVPEPLKDDWKLKRSTIEKIRELKKIEFKNGIEGKEIRKKIKQICRKNGIEIKSLLGWKTIVHKRKPIIHFWRDYDIITLESCSVERYCGIIEEDTGLEIEIPPNDLYRNILYYDYLKEDKRVSIPLSEIV